MHSISQEQPKTIIRLAEAILGFQDSSVLQRNKDHLKFCSVRPSIRGKNFIFLRSADSAEEWEGAKSLDVEAVLLDEDGNKLHVIAYANRTERLFAIEVFAWDEWSGAIDLNSITRVDFSNNGVYTPQ